MQWRAVTLAGSAVVATMIGTANLLSRLYYDVLENGDTFLAVLLPVGAVVGLLLLLLSCFGCYHRRWLEQVCARRLCGTRWSKKALVSPENEATAKEEARQGPEAETEPAGNAGQK